MNESIDRLLNQKQVAEWIGMSEAWLEQCRFRGIGLPYVKIGKACRYRVRPAWRVSRKRHLFDCGGQAVTWR